MPLIVTAALPGGWQTDRPDAWTNPSPGLLRQGQTKQTSAWIVAEGTGTCWRCTVVPGPYGGTAGLRFGTNAKGKDGLLLALESIEDAPGLYLRDAAGKILWADRFMGWKPYEPVRVEAVIAGDRLYVQALQRAKDVLLAQSDWLPIPAPTGNSLALVSRHNTAEFTEWARATKALWQPDPNSPSKLRLQQHGETSWTVVGGGNWQWADSTRKVLLQREKTERTTAFMSAPRVPGQTWRCRIQLDKGTCGGGMVMLADNDLQHGFICWLGGKYGAGSLMLYRFPLNCLWSSPQGKWQWDAEYVLEGTVKNGKIAVRMLAEDGQTVIAASPERELLPAELKRPGMNGFQTWRGTGRFRDFSAATVISGGSTAPPAPPRTDVLRAGWTVATGTWTQPAASNNSAEIIAHTGSGPGEAHCSMIKGARGTFSVRVEPGAKARSVALLFQVDPKGRLGFELRLGVGGCELRTFAGDVLWKDPELTLSAGKWAILEGMVLTDRLQVRIADGTGKELAASPDCYVSDTNNERVGHLGVRCHGPAEFADWKWVGE